MTTFLRNITLLILIAGVSAAAQWPAETAMSRLTLRTISSSATATAFAGWQVLESEQLDGPAAGFGAPITMTEAEALHQVLSMAGSASEFNFMTSTQVKDLRRVFYAEHRNGLPVLTGRLDLVFSARDRPSRWSLREHSRWPAVDSHLLQMNAAASRLASEDRADWEIAREQSFAAWYPDHESHQLRPVYWIRIEGSEPHERWEGIVDAVSGEVIMDWAGIHTDTVSGTVSGPYWQPYMHSEPQVAPHAFGTVDINANDIITAIDGSFQHETGQSADMTALLRGPYVQVRNEDAEDGQLPLYLEAPFEPVNMLWTTDFASAPELNLFHHTMLIKLWYAVLDPDFTALDYPLPAVANVGQGYDNAYWNGFGTYYGSGAQYNNFAMYSDIIYHEYTHGVTDGIYPNGMLPYTGQSGALNEAWSDYFACTINGDPLMAEWIGGQPGGEFRDLENNLVFPDNWAGEVHADSRFVSAALWRIREQLGAEFTDDLSHFARYALAETFIDYLIAVLETDDDDGNLVNGTPHAQVIYDAFGIHGIGPGDDPNFVIDRIEYYADGSGGSIGNGNRFIEAGETAELSFRLTNDVVLYPPPATDVNVVVTASSPDIEIVNGGRFFPSMGPAAAVDIDAVQLEVSASAADQWAVIYFQVTSNAGTVSYLDSIEVTVGLPHLLIVQDDAATEVEKFVTRTARNQNRIFDTIELSAGATLPDEYLPSYGMVLWLSGNAEGSVLTSEDQWKLRDFIAAGNKLVLSGQYLARNLAGTNFAQSTLEVEIVEEPTAIRRVTADGGPFGNEEWYMLAGSGGASNQLAMTMFNPLGGSEAVGYYGYDEASTAMVEFQNGRGLLLGYGIEAISDETHLGNSDRAAFLQRLYDWAGALLPVQEETFPRALPAEWSLGPAYPNPFNPSTNVPYEVPTLRRAEYFVFDLLGRVVDAGELHEQRGVIVWRAAAPTGIYFLQTRWNGGISKPQKLMLLK